MLTASITIQTSIFDLQSLYVTKLAAQQDMNLLDYIIHVLKTPKQMELINSFYDVNSTSFPLLDPKTKREMTSHEYFRARIIERSLYGLQLQAEEMQVTSFYVGVIENAIEGRCYWSGFEEALVNNTILRLEELLSTRSEEKKSFNLKNMNELTRLFRTLLSLNVNDAFILLDPAAAEPILQKDTSHIQAHLDSLTFCKAIQQYTRDYECFDHYSKSVKQSTWTLLAGVDDLRSKNGVQSTDINQSHLQELAKKLDTNSIREEIDCDRKSILVRAVLEQKPLDVEYQLHCIGSPYSHFIPVARTETAHFLQLQMAKKFARNVRVPEKARLKSITSSILVC